MASSRRQQRSCRWSPVGRTYEVGGQVESSQVKSRFGRAYLRGGRSSRVKSSQVTFRSGVPMRWAVKSSRVKSSHVSVGRTYEVGGQVESSQVTFRSGVPTRWAVKSSHVTSPVRRTLLMATRGQVKSRQVTLLMATRGRVKSSQATLLMATRVAERVSIAEYSLPTSRDHSRDHSVNAQRGITARGSASAHI
jgi:hypothetical protein